MPTKVLRQGAASVACFLTLVLAERTARAQSPAYQKFFGEYVGELISESKGAVEKRDINAKIAPHKNGFTVTWVLTIRKAAGKVQRDDTTVTFQPTNRENIYSAGMRVDVFGNAVPLDPLRGDPYLWARIEGQMLTIHALTVTENGGYEMQRYDRTLTPGGMDLRYSRVRDGQVLRTITGKLKKVR